MWDNQFLKVKWPSLKQCCMMIALLASVRYSTAQCPDLTWTGLSGMPTLPVSILADPIVASNDDGRLEVFIIGSDGAIWHSWQMQGNLKQWSGWASFGHPQEAVVSVPNEFTPLISVCRDKAGRLQLFAVINNGTLWQIGQVQKNINWGNWHSLGRPGAPSGAVAGVWSVANLDGRI